MNRNHHTHQHDGINLRPELALWAFVSCYAAQPHEACITKDSKSGALQVRPVGAMLPSDSKHNRHPTQHADVLQPGQLGKHAWHMQISYTPMSLLLK
jgi:hypothetical protein